MPKSRPSTATASKAAISATKPAGRRKKPAQAKIKPGRPTADRVKAINRAILVAARKEFRVSGYEAARMEAIAATAGVSKGTLYDRYPTKEALLRAVVADRVATYSEDFEPDGGPIPTDLRQRLKHRAHYLMEYYCSGKVAFIERLFNSGPSLDELRRTRYEVGQRRTIQVIAQDIIQGTIDQPVDPQTAVRLAEMLMGTLYGWWRMHHDVRPVTREEALAFADHVVNVLFSGRAAW